MTVGSVSGSSTEDTTRIAAQNTMITVGSGADEPNGIWDQTTYRRFYNRQVT